MKLGVTIILLPAALALPSYNAHGHGHLHSHGSRPYKSGLPSGQPFQAGSAAGPYGMSNSTLNQAGTSAGNAATTSTATSQLTNYLTLYNTLSLYPSATASEAADTGSGGSGGGAGGAGGSCGGTITVTEANTVTVTVTGDEEASATAVTPESQTPVTPNQAPETQAPVAPVASSAAPAPVASLTAPAPVASSAAPAQVASSAAPAQVASLAAPAPVASSTAPAPVASSTAPAPVASSTAPATSPASVAPVEHDVASPTGNVLSLSTAPGVPGFVPIASPEFEVALSTKPVPNSAWTVSMTSLSATPYPSGSSGTEGKTSPKPPGSKRGLFIPVSQDATQHDYVETFNANPGKISWIVNQFSGPPGNLSSEFQYVPQCYDKFSDISKPDSAPHPWTTNAERAIATGTENFFLSFGEPNTPNEQGFTMDAQEGAQEFMTMLQPWAVNYGVTVGSPGTLGMPDDYQWQNDFLDECAKLGCKIGWVSAHWFSPCGKATAQELADTFWGTINIYKEIAQNHSSQYGIDLKVWVDNFSLSCDSQTQTDFLDIVVPEMDNDPMIERYGYVSITHISQGNGFVNTDGSISELGLHYANM
ncbi:hypothetical protein JMJ35_006249 [Cladonia borealis]|uniref:Asl1-like glycosyl hydrolase catalytic domain-containing protein n=1 Tax=Cladonia borealis TaxID=184061 RepID=A0AA39U9S8_9LECA|nr:hypothetical protein JMJ35_006249 [Cladonia borealis]